MDTTLAEIKRKLRKLKKLERILNAGPDSKLIWNDFFNVKYPPPIIAKMEKDSYKKVVEEYLYFVYYKHYLENRTAGTGLHDPEALKRLGLPYDADMEMIKSKFRELAKKHHPDAGGESADFIGLMENYKRLVEK